MPRRWLVLIVVTAGAFLANLDLFIVNIAFPAIQEDFPQASLSGLSWVVSGYAIVFAALLVPAGRLADLLGRKRLFLAGLGLFLLASALCGAATGPWMLIAARLLQAVGAALLIPTSLALLLPEFPPSGRAAAVGLWTAGAAVAATLGPTIGGLLVELSWRWVFLVNLPLGAITAVAAVRVLRESRDPARARVPDLLGALLLAVGVGALALGIVKGGEWGWTSGRVVGAETLALVALVAFGARSARHPAPVVEAALLRVAGTRVANAGVFLFSMSFFGLLLGTVLFLTGVWHYSALEAGLAFAPGPLMVALLSWPAGSLAGRVGPRPLALAGTLIFALGCGWWLWRVGASPAYAADLLPGIIATGIGVSLTFPVLAGAAVGGLPADRSATGSALFNMSRQIGGVIGVAILVSVLGDDPSGLHEHRVAWTFMAAGSLAAGAVALLLPRGAAAGSRSGDLAQRPIDRGGREDVLGDHDRRSRHPGAVAELAGDDA